MSTAVANPIPLGPPVRQRLLTAADLAVLPRHSPSGDVKYELDDGRLVVMAPPGTFTVAVKPRSSVTSDY